MSRVGFTLPNVFGTKTVKGPLSDLDNNFNPLKNAILDSGNGYSNFGSATGTVNAIAVTNNPPALTLVPGASFGFVVTGANTGPVTLNVDGLGAASVVAANGGALSAGDINGFTKVVYDGTKFYVVTTSRAVASYYGVDGSNNTNYAITVASTFVLANGVIVNFFVSNSNSSANPTLNVNGTGAKPIVNKRQIALGANVLRANITYTAFYDANNANWRITSPLMQQFVVANPANPVIECNGYDRVHVACVYTSPTGAGITLNHLDEGVPVDVYIQNSTATTFAYYINSTNSTGGSQNTYWINVTNASGSAIAQLDSSVSPGLSANQLVFFEGCVSSGILRLH